MQNTTEYPDSNLWTIEEFIDACQALHLPITDIRNNLTTYETIVDTDEGDEDSQAEEQNDSQMSLDQDMEKLDISGTPDPEISISGQQNLPSPNDLLQLPEIPDYSQNTFIELIQMYIERGWQYDESQQKKDMVAALLTADSEVYNRIFRVLDYLMRHGSSGSDQLPEAAIKKYFAAEEQVLIVDAWAERLHLIARNEQDQRDLQAGLEELRAREDECLSAAHTWGLDPGSDDEYLYP